MSAIKYHINNNGEAGLCRAKVKCRFGGESGKENHFDSAEAAQAAISEKLKEEFSQIASVRRKETSPQFLKSREAIKAALVSYGGVNKAEELPEVNNADEMVEKWFSGDSSRYKSFKRLTEANDITHDTKKSVGEFVQKGLPVSISGSVYEVPTANVQNMFNDSEIDLLEEIPGSKIDMDAVRRGEFRAFS